MGEREREKDQEKHIVNMFNITTFKIIIWVIIDSNTGTFCDKEIEKSCFLKITELN